MVESPQRGPRFRTSYTPGATAGPVSGRRSEREPLHTPLPGGEAAAKGPGPRTTLPPRQHIRCFECGYEFDLTGRMNSTHCPKCRTTLDLAGYVIDAPSSDTLKTLGTIRITERGVVTGAHLLATDIDLAGRIKDSLAQAFRYLIVRPGADFIRKEVVSPDLKIEAHAEVRFRDEAAYRNVELWGTLRTRLFASGTVIIHAGAVFEGALTTGHLVVEDGARVQAEMNVGPDGLKEAERRFKELRENPPLSFAAERIVVPAVLTAPEQSGEAALLNGAANSAQA